MKYVVDLSDRRMVNDGLVFAGEGSAPSPVLVLVESRYLKVRGMVA